MKDRIFVLEFFNVFQATSETTVFSSRSIWRAQKQSNTSFACSCLHLQISVALIHFGETLMIFFSPLVIDWAWNISFNECDIIHAQSLLNLANS